MTKRRVGIQGGGKRGWERLGVADERTAWRSERNGGEGGKRRRGKRLKKDPRTA